MLLYISFTRMRQFEVKGETCQEIQDSKSLHSVVVSTPTCYAGDPGSIPSRGGDVIY